jgi:hypothetical protein
MGCMEAFFFTSVYRECCTMYTRPENELSSLSSNCLHIQDHGVGYYQAFSPSGNLIFPPLLQGLVFFTTNCTSISSSSLQALPKFVGISCSGTLYWKLPSCCSGSLPPEKKTLES